MAKAREPDEVKQSHPWIIDSGCTQHMTFDRSAFVTYTEQQTDRTITVGTKAETKVAGTGDIDIKVSVDGKLFNVRLMNVLHVPGIGYQLLSVSQISNKGLMSSSMIVVVIYLLTAVLLHMALSANRCTISTCTALAPISRVFAKYATLA